jgi:signal transduction histidine kinase
MSLRIAKKLGSTAAWRLSIWSTVAFALASLVAFAVMIVLASGIMRSRTDAWLRGEVAELVELSHTSPPPQLTSRIGAEVAEFAALESAWMPSGSAQASAATFFLEAGPGETSPVWVGPLPRAPFLAAIERAQLQPNEPRTIAVQGWQTPFRVIFCSPQPGVRVYFGISDDGAANLLYLLIKRFGMVWVGMVVLGFVISFESARRTLLRVQAMSAMMDSIGTDDLSRRLPESPQNDEISRLTHKFNLMLNRLQKSVNQLRVVTGSVAHDLKSPVTSIRGKLEAAISSESNSLREAVGEAIEGLDQLSELLNTTLDLAEAEAGALQLRRESVDLSNLVQQMAFLYHAPMAEQDLELVVDVQPHVIVSADVKFMNRALVNLLNNELAHLPKGCHVRLAVQQSNRQAELLIEDDGPGFSPELRGRALERFVKGEQSSGHGLGLAFVDAIVQAHGGEVKIAERPGGGAIVSLFLPLSTAAKVQGK